MGCSHAQDCPLFPLLNASLSAWRHNYCDSAEGWLTCARYQLYRTGQLVPITLLPNGVDVFSRRRPVPAAAPRSTQPVNARRPRTSATSREVSDGLPASESANATEPTVGDPDRSGARDKVSDAWVLAVADDARRRGGERLHVWVTSQEMPCAAPSPIPQSGEPSHLDGSMVAVAWFEPAGAAWTETLTGSRCEAQVEAAILLGLPRWTSATHPARATTWGVGLRATGLALLDPSGHVFASGVGEIPSTWTTAARARGAVAVVYGVGPLQQAGHLEPLPAQRLTEARRDGTVAAAWVPLLE